MPLLNRLKILRKRKFRKQKKDNSFCNIIKAKAKEFCLATNLHGYTYIGQTKRPKSERCVWAIIVFSLFCCSIALIKVAWDYNSSRLTQTIIESVHHGIWNFPFPAVTVCNVNQISLKKAQNFVSNLKDLNGLKKENILDDMVLLLEMLDPGIFGYDIQFNLSLLQGVFEANNYTAPQVMQLVKPDCSKLIQNCKWKGKSYLCDSMFEEIYARDGICCSFNYFHAKSRINKKGRRPLILNSCGYQTGLTFQVHPEPQDYFATLYGAYGVKVIIHYPYDYPMRSAEYKLVGLGVQNFLSISPQQTYATQAFSELSVESRMCVFDENGLPEDLKAVKHVFNMFEYTFPNCMNYCRAKVAADECDCVPYYLPQNVTRICELTDLTCLKKVRHMYDISWPGFDIDSADLPFAKIDLTKRPCDCMTDCNSHKYPLDSTQGPLNKEFIGVNNPNSTNNFGSFSLINVFYTDLVALQYRKNVFFTWKYLFAGFGGLLGLFVGFSITNGLEFIYFFIIRAIIDIYNNKKKRKRVIRFQRHIKTYW